MTTIQDLSWSQNHAIGTSNSIVPEKSPSLRQSEESRKLSWPGERTSSISTRPFRRTSVVSRKSTVTETKREHEGGTTRLPVGRRATWPSVRDEQLFDRASGPKNDGAPLLFDEEVPVGLMREKQKDGVVRSLCLPGCGINSEVNLPGTRLSLPLNKLTNSSLYTNETQRPLFGASWHAREGQLSRQATGETL